jgi:hypothetical protein
MTIPQDITRLQPEPGAAVREHWKAILKASCSSFWGSPR